MLTPAPLRPCQNATGTPASQMQKAQKQQMQWRIECVRISDGQARNFRKGNPGVQCLSKYV